MQPIIIQSSRAAWLGYLIVALGFVPLGAVLLVKNASSPLGWARSFSLPPALSWLYAIYDRRPRVTTDDEGINDRTLRYGLIEWGDIEGAYLERKSAGTFVRLELRDAKKYTKRLSATGQRMVARNAKVGATPVSLHLTGTDVKPEDILVVIEKELRARWAARAGAAP